MLGSFPTDPAARTARRAQITAALHALADLRATEAGRTAYCGGLAAGGVRPSFEPRHHGDPGGCPDDGSACVCWCHDQQRTGTPPATLRRPARVVAAAASARR